MKTYIEEKTFDKDDFTKEFLPIGEYEQCSFINCDFSSSDLSNSTFYKCKFICCNLSLVKLKNTTFNEVHFKDCKLLGLHFDDCNNFLFAAFFENCTLNLSCFYKMKLKTTKFKNATLHEVDFTETNFTGCNLDNCDLSRVIFKNSILEKVDLRTCVNYSIDPEENKIKKAKFSLSGIIGLLDKYDIDIG